MKTNIYFYNEFPFFATSIFFLCLICPFISNSQINNRENINLNKMGPDPHANFILMEDYLDGCQTNLANNFIFDYGWNCKRHNDFCVMVDDRVNCDGNSLILSTLFDEQNPYDCVLAGISKGYSTPYSGGMINQDNNGTYTYGYFEAEIIMPNSRSVFPAFWLAGPPGGAAGYNEMDIMEYGVGDAVVHTSHILDPNTGFGVAQQKWNYCLPGQSFSNNAIKYGLLWDKNKAIWYVNNNPVKIVTDIGNLHPIVNTPMSVIANNQISLIGKGLDYLPENFNTEMIINYIKVYNRQNINNGSVNFTINNKKSNLGQPIILPQQSPCTKINVELSNSYLPGHNFYFKLFQYTNCNYLTPNLIASGWIAPAISASECRTNIAISQNIYEFDLSSIINCNLFNNVNSCYSLLIGARSQNCLDDCSTCLQNEFSSSDENYFNIVPCVSYVDFNINGISTTCKNLGKFTECLVPIEIDDNHGKSRIIMELEKTITCADDYFVSIELSDQTGGRTGVEITKWLTNSEKELFPYIDIEEIWSNPSNPFTSIEPGMYYRVKLATNGGVNWTEKVQLIHIAGCTVDAEFTLNGVSDDNIPIPINLGDDLILDATNSEFCSQNYTISIVEIGNNLNSFSRTFDVSEKIYFPPNTTGIKGKAQYKYYQGRMNLLEELIQFSNGQFKLECGKSYYIFLNILSDPNYINCCGYDLDMKIININDCVPNSEFSLYGDYCTTPYSSLPSQTFKNSTSVRLWANEFQSCNNTAKIIIAPLYTSQFPNAEITINNQEELLILKKSGDYNLTSIIKEYFGGAEAVMNKSYNVTLIAFGDLNCGFNGVPNESTTIQVNYTVGGCGTPFNKENLSFRVKSDHYINLHPNPVIDQITLTTDLNNTEILISILTIGGEIAQELSVFSGSGNSKFYLNENLKPGMYICQIKFLNEIKSYKIVKF